MRRISSPGFHSTGSGSKAETGSAILELAIVLPVLVAMIVGVFTTAQLIKTYFVARHVGYLATTQSMETLGLEQGTFTSDKGETPAGHAAAYSLVQNLLTWSEVKDNSLRDIKITSEFDGSVVQLVITGRFSGIFGLLDGQEIRVKTVGPYIAS